MRILRNHLMLILVLVIGFALRIAAILADPFLHPWDERFHALVARNMMYNPFVPILRVNPITENYDKFVWCCNHIWLHKQPLFMWQMALSMKIFGVSEWSMRLPSAIMGTLLILIIYRIAILANFSKQIALFTALLLAFSNFHLKMIAGIHGMDHNDVAHGFYVLASIWTLCEYNKSPKWYWIMLIGVFSGAAILNKWLTGLLVFMIWGISIIISIYKKDKPKKEILHLFLSILICCIVFVPWQLYILNKFPDLARFEYEFNRRHITEALEGHEGSYFYYFKFLGSLFGKYLYLLIPIGMIISIRHRNISRSINISIISAILFVFFFFSIIVKTKVDTYLFFVAPLAMIYISIVLDFIVKKWNIIFDSVYAKFLLVAILLVLCLNPIWIYKYFSKENTERNNRIYNASIYRDLSQHLPDSYRVVMNMNSFEDIDVMFYNEGITAYHWTLPEEDFKDFEKRKINIAVFAPHGDYQPSEFVMKYPYLHIINLKLKDF